MKPSPAEPTKILTAGYAGQRSGPDISTPESRVLASAAMAHPKLDREGYRRSWARRVNPWRSRKAS